MNKKISLFIVDDDPRLRALLSDMLPPSAYEVSAFASSREVLSAVNEREYDVGIIDMNMPEMNGLELVKLLKSRELITELVVLTGQATLDNAIEAMKLGCYDYLAKPVKLDELEMVVQKAYDKRNLLKENITLKEELHLKDTFHELVGKSEKMKAVYSLIRKVAKSPSLVLITGESGTGKELVAKALHKDSNRSDKPFIIIDCASLSENILENELFGHEKGAYTDANSMKRGLFEVADSGTLFIDEIGEMKTSTQAKLLRVIETHRFRRLGGNQEIAVDVRIIAATNRNLKEEVKKGNFREDLYHRINVVNIQLPPLRERKEDIPSLVKHFIANSSADGQKKRIREDDMSFLMEYNWPGNVRELANVLERVLILSANDFIKPEDFPQELTQKAFLPAAHASGTLAQQMESVEREIVKRALEKCKGNKQEAAKSLGISRANLYRKIEHYRLTSDQEQA
ncbi:MAG: hypothetical protein A2293_05775 [Elusimicrobia bacterium RIFOXYB2_FULL_49_7]|nr:MAG: hypothetical protein A2293_05775 [Elusimicrobia bacterium RIFOXYB2_FULL_49_7]